MTEYDLTKLATLHDGIEAVRLLEPMPDEVMDALTDAVFALRERIAQAIELACNETAA